MDVIVVGRLELTSLIDGVGGEYSWAAIVQYQ